MNIKYYFRNILWGIFFLTIYIFHIWGDLYNFLPELALVVISSILFPFSKKIIEHLAFKFTSPTFWYKGVFIETAGKNGLYAIYYLFCFIFAIPLGIAYFVNLFIIKRATKK